MQENVSNSEFARLVLFYQYRAERFWHNKYISFYYMSKSKVFVVPNLLATPHDKQNNIFHLLLFLYQCRAPKDETNVFVVPSPSSTTSKISSASPPFDKTFIFLIASDDVSWRLRQCLTLSLAALQQELPYAKYRGKLLHLYQKLSQDSEAEVRVIAASSLFRYCGHLKEAYQKENQNQNNFEPVFEQSIMAIMRRLALDESEEVRLALSSNVLPLSTLLSEQCFEKNIIAFLLEVLGKEESIMIQTNFLLGLSKFSGKVDLTQSLSAIKDSVEAVIQRSQANWRTRRSVLLTLVDIAKFCDAIYFSENFKLFYTQLLEDPVFAVRRSASLILPIISKHYGIQWAREHLVAVLEKFCHDSRYLYRFVALFGIVEMVQPQLFPQPYSYLEDLKKLVKTPEATTAHRALAKIVKSLGRLQEELGSERYKAILQLTDDVNYSSSFLSDIYTEAEFRTLEGLNLNIYSVESGDLCHSAPYLQGILELIHNTFLPIITYLHKDPTENVQMGAICTLGVVSDFVTKLSEEAAQEWVQESCTQLSGSELQVIGKEVEDEFVPGDYNSAGEVEKHISSMGKESTDPEPLEVTPSPISRIEEKLDLTLSTETDCLQPEKRVLPLI